MEWHQQYGRFCRDCEYWQGLSYPNRKSKDFKGIQGTCHRLPPLLFCQESGQWIKPVTLDSDGCGEFKLISHLQKDVSIPVAEPVLPVQNPPNIENPCGDKEGLLNVKGLAAILNIGVTHIYSMRSCGQLPMPVKLGGSVRWIKREICDWIQEGCPPLHKWEVIKKHKKY